ncbi:MAG: hypothetical protein IJW86_07460 [Clostridia bacterium]|nr:hypothetical protein [Clostridia bacterium]
MISVSDVYTILCTYETSKGYTSEELFPCCERGLRWVMSRLKEGTDENDPLIAVTAAAIANFYFFIRRLSDTDTFESYKVGDMTISRNPEKELRLAMQKRSLAIAEASSILNDGGFYCSGR